MLILTRRVRETIIIGDDIQVTILGIKGNQVRIGVNADKSVSVHRAEIYERIKREERSKANSRDDELDFSTRASDYTHER